MKLYLITQSENTGYDTYDSAVVCAKNEDEARNIHPGDGDWDSPYSSWCKHPKHVTVELLGNANKGVPKGVVCASFNAG